MQRSHIPARIHDLVWSSWFRINSRMVSQVKAGRLVLGGGATHIHSPAGAQGMRPDGYAALTTPADRAAPRLDAYRAKWMAAG